MYLLHYIIPLIIFYFYRDKLMLWGLLLGNFVDLGHVYYRIIGKVGWFESACPQLGMQCSFGFYPFHNLGFAIAFLLFSGLIFIRGKKLKKLKVLKILNFLGWLSLGAFMNLALDYIHLLSGFGI